MSQPTGMPLAAAASADSLSSWKWLSRWRWEVALVVCLLAPLFLGAPWNITFDESYYFMWAHHPQLSYLDHPPLVGWLLTSVKELGAHPMLTRLPVLLCGLVQVLSTAVLARRVLGEEVSRRSAVLVAALPIFAFSYILIGPDAPFMAGWAAAVCLLERAVTTNRAWAWLGFGTALGLCLLSKLTSFIFFGPLFLYVALYQRAHWFNPRLYAALAWAGALFLPVVWWSVENEGGPFRFQMTLGARHMEGAPSLWTLGEFLAGQALLITPLGLAAVVLAFHWAWQQRRDPGVALLALFGVVPSAVFVMASSRQAVELNWALCAWWSVMPLVVRATPRLVPPILALSAATWLGVVVHRTYPMAAPQSDVMARADGWQDVSRDVQACAAAHARPGWYILGDSRRETSQLFYAMGAQVEARPAAPDAGRFFFLGNPSWAGRDAILVVDMREAREGYVAELADRANLRVVARCEPSPRRRVDGAVIESFGLWVLQP